MTLPLSAPGTGGYSTTSTVILGKMPETLTGEPIDRILTDVAMRAGLTQSALQAPEVTKMPDPASDGYVAAPGAKDMEAVGATRPGEEGDSTPRASRPGLPGLSVRSCDHAEE